MFWQNMLKKLHFDEWLQVLMDEGCDFFVTVITVTITPNGDTFLGFLIRAGRADPNLDQTTAIGSFAVPAGGSNDYKILCQQNTSVCT